MFSVGLPPIDAICMYKQLFLWHGSAQKILVWYFRASSLGICLKIRRTWSVSSIPILLKAALQRKMPLNIQDTASKTWLLGNDVLKPTWQISAFPTESYTSYLGSLKGISGLGTWSAKQYPFCLVCNMYPPFHSVPIYTEVLFKNWYLSIFS